MKRGGHSRDESYLDLDDTLYSRDSDLGSVGTESEEDGVALVTLEEAILRRPSPVHQWIRR